MPPPHASLVTFDRLIDDLWGEDLPANPTNALQVRVSKLRRQLGGRIITQPTGYALEVDPTIGQLDLDTVVECLRALSGWGLAELGLVLKQTSLHFVSAVTAFSRTCNGL